MESNKCPAEAVVAAAARAHTAGAGAVMGASMLNPVAGLTRSALSWARVER